MLCFEPYVIKVHKVLYVNGRSHCGGHLWLAVNGPFKETIPIELFSKIKICMFIEPVQMHKQGRSDILFQIIDFYILGS